VPLDRCHGDDQRIGDALVGAPLGHQREHFQVARGELV
jgi:hypothetical protein